MVRSPHAHARIRSIDTAAALAVPGVLAVLTGTDWVADGLKPIPNKTFSWHPAEIPLINTDGSPPFNAPDFPLPLDKARFVGEAVAMVVAETVGAAKDGAEQVVDRLRGAAVRDLRAATPPSPVRRCCTSTTARTSASTPRSATPRRPRRRSRAPRMS